MSTATTETAQPRGWVARRIALGTLANFANPVTAIVTGPLLARTLGPAGRGELAGLIVPLTFVATVGLLGVPLAATYLAAKSYATPRQILRGSAPIIGASSVLSVVGLVALAPVLLHAHPDDVRLFRVAALTVPFGLVMDVMGAIVLGRRRYGLTYLAAVTGAGVRAAALVVLALFGALTVTSAVWATLLPGLFVMVLYARVFRSGEESDPPPRVPVTRTLSSYGLRSWGIGIAGTANARLDQVLLLPVAGAAQLGYYAVAVSLAELTTPITGAISQVLFPEAAARRSWKSVSKAARCTMLVVVTIAVGGIATAPFLVPLLFGNEFSKAVPMAQILFVAGVPLALRLVMGSGLLAAGRPWASSTSQVLALCVTAPGLILLVPRFGGIGAACTSLAAYSTACTFSYRQARRASGLGLRELLVPGRDDVRWLLRQAEYCVPRKRRPVTGDA